MAYSVIGDMICAIVRISHQALVFVALLSSAEVVCRQGHSITHYNILSSLGGRVNLDGFCGALHEDPLEHWIDKA